MNPMQSPNTGVGRRLCPEGREDPEVYEPDEVIAPGRKSTKEIRRDGEKALHDLGAVFRIWRG